MRDLYNAICRPRCKYFSRAKAQRTLGNAAALCAFAREFVSETCASRAKQVHFAVTLSQTCLTYVIKASSFLLSPPTFGSSLETSRGESPF